MKHLFRDKLTIKELISGKILVIFLDYDGTIVPIAKRPHMAVMDSATRNLLGKLSADKSCELAIVSGRALNDIKKMVGLSGIVYSGNHGLEIEGPKTRFKFPVGQKYLGALKKIKEGLLKSLPGIKGVVVEDKGLSLSMHYRGANRKNSVLARAAFHEQVVIYAAKGLICVKPGKKVLEVRPSVLWDKGKVVLFLLARAGFVPGCNNILPVYLGDDASDEDAFKALKGRGLTIYVGRPRQSRADYYLNNHLEVKRFLKFILDSQKEFR